MIPYYQDSFRMSHHRLIITVNFTSIENLYNDLYVSRANLMNRRKRLPSKKYAGGICDMTLYYLL